MGLHLTRRDHTVVGVFLAISLLIGFLLEFLDRSALITVHDATFYLPGPALFLGAVFIYMARERLGGAFARNLEIVGASITILAAAWIVFAAFFAAGFPSWGVSAAFWVTFLNTLIALMFLTAGYGFYRFWRLAQDDGGGT